MDEEGDGRYKIYIQIRSEWTDRDGWLGKSTKVKKKFFN